MDQSLGAVTWWGFSPSLDLLEYRKLCSQVNSEGVYNVLLVGSGDIRHILNTLSRRGRYGYPKINFYVIENNLEVYARCMMLTSVALQKSERMGLQEKTELFLEIFGNSLVRSQTASFIQAMSTQFVKMVTDFDYLNQQLPLFNLDQLKYKERDMLEGIFKLWRTQDKEVFDIEKCWDLRVRSLLGIRYDSAKGVFDWDYSMKLAERGAGIIGSRNYQRWRKTGVAFELREAEYDMPNKTLCSGMIFKVDGERVGRRGMPGLQSQKLSVSLLSICQIKVLLFH